VGGGVGPKAADCFDGEHNDVRVVGEPAVRYLDHPYNVAFDRLYHCTGLPERGTVLPLFQFSADGPCLNRFATVPKVESVGDVPIVGPLQDVWQDPVQPRQKKDNVCIVDVFHLSIDPFCLVQQAGCTVGVQQLQKIEQVYFGRGVPKEYSSNVGGSAEQRLFKL